MRARYVFRKTLLELSRDRWMLGLTLAFAPFFVLLATDSLGRHKTVK